MWVGSSHLLAKNWPRDNEFLPRFLKPTAYVIDSTEEVNELVISGEQTILTDKHILFFANLSHVFSTRRDESVGSPEFCDITAKGI